MHKKYQGDDKDHCAVCGDKTGNNCLAGGVYLIKLTIKFVVLIGSRWVSAAGRNSAFLHSERVSFLYSSDFLTKAYNVTSHVRRSWNTERINRNSHDRNASRPAAGEKFYKKRICFIAESLFSECFPLHFPQQIFVQIWKKKLKCISLLNPNNFC